MPAAEVPNIIVTPEADPLIGRVLGNYVIRKRLREGGMGAVYVAEHERLGQKAAVKVLKREVATDGEWARRFLTEAQAGARLQSPNLVRVIDFGTMEDGYEYLLMEFLDGVPLDEYCAALRAEGKLDVASVLTFVEQILAGLGAAHAGHVFHRDLKPSNVMVLQDHAGKPLLKLIDFGLARAAPLAMQPVAGRSNQASLMAGTPEYVAPEQARGQVVDGRADLYSLGVMLYEMLAGHLPFDGDVETVLRAHLSQPPPPLPDEVASDLPEGLAELVDSLLAKEPDQRPPSADAVRKQVQRMLRKVRPEETQLKRNPLLAEPPRPQAAVETLRIERVAPAASSAEASPPSRRAAWFLLPGLLLLVGGGLWLARRSEPVREPARPAPPPPVAEATPTPPATPIDIEPVPPEELPAPVETPPQARPLEVRPSPKGAHPTKPKPAPPDTAPAIEPSKPEVLQRPTPPPVNERCLNLDEWRVTERRRAEAIETAAREQLLDAKASVEDIRREMATLDAVRRQVAAADSPEACDQAIRALTRWAREHGL